MKLTTKFVYLASTVLLGSLVLNLSSCKNEDDTPPPPTTNNLDKQVRVQVAYDASEVAFRYVWKSQKKLYPAGQANTGQNYPGQFHDFYAHNGTKFDRLPSGARMEEDRVSFMIDKNTNGITGFNKAGCAVSCHTTMASHNLGENGLTGLVDHWHWRGARSGPMGYAEDAGVNEIERIRDASSGYKTKFTRSGGDRLREDQISLTGTTHPVLVDGFPRFVLNKGKNVAGYTVPSYFVTNEANQVITDPYLQAPSVRDLSKNRSLIVAYQDKAFDAVDKVNAVDLGYLVYVAYGETAQLPAHLQDETTADFIAYKDYWAIELGITTAAAAVAKLDAIHAEWVASNKKAMVTRSVGFIYNSDQHDITTERSYDASRNEWTVVLRRSLNTSGTNDVQLGGLDGGETFTISFAMHDSGGGSETHDISMPLQISKDATADIVAKKVSNVNNVDWNSVPAYDTYWVKQSVMPHFGYDWLSSPSHPGAGALGTMKCVDCHKDANSLLPTSVIQ